MSVLIEILLWLVRKFGVALLVVAIGLMLGGVYLYLRDEMQREAQRGLDLETLRARAVAVEERALALGEQLANLRTEIEKQEQRAEIARRLLRSYEEMRNFWDWLFGPPIDRQELAAKEARAREQRDGALERAQALALEVAGVAGEHDATTAEAARLRTEISLLEQAKTPVLTYARRAWYKYRWYLATALLGYFFGPSLWKVFSFYAVAPLIARARPIRIRPTELPAIRATTSRVSDAVELHTGDALFLKERFLQASDESLRRRTRFVLDWRIPFTCAACGLIELVELRNRGEGVAFVTVSTQDDTSIELSLVDVPAGASLVLRPSFLAGVAIPHGGRLRIRRHWRLFHLQAWLTLQFRFFEFCGPCRLVVAGTRGVRAENLAGDMRPRGRARRTNQDSTIGFTPDLEYRSARAETFWSYYRGRNPLFDDLFFGRGTFLCQEIASDGPAAKARKFWSTLWDGVLRVFGL